MVLIIHYNLFPYKCGHPKNTCCALLRMRSSSVTIVLTTMDNPQAGRTLRYISSASIHIPVMEVRIRFCPIFRGTHPISWDLNSSVPTSHKTPLPTPKCLVFPNHSNSTFLTSRQEILTFELWEGNIYSTGTAIELPLTDQQVNWWCDYYYYYYYYFVLSVCNNFISSVHCMIA
jgi:hypothetical protein